jgi:hypothetical protein
MPCATRPRRRRRLRSRDALVRCCVVCVGLECHHCAPHAFDRTSYVASASVLSSAQAHKRVSAVLACGIARTLPRRHTRPLPPHPRGSTHTPFPLAIISG